MVLLRWQGERLEGGWKPGQLRSRVQGTFPARDFSRSSFWRAWNWNPLNQLRGSVETCPCLQEMNVALKDNEERHGEERDKQTKTFFKRGARGVSVCPSARMPQSSAEPLSSRRRRLWRAGRFFDGLLLMGRGTDKRDKRLQERLSPLQANTGPINTACGATFLWGCPRPLKATSATPCKSIGHRAPKPSMLSNGRHPWFPTGARFESWCGTGAARGEAQTGGADGPGRLAGPIATLRGRRLCVLNWGPRFG